jgi:AraC-like DNA-binding protein
MAFVPPARHLLRARDLADARFVEPLTVAGLARAAGLSRAHHSTRFRRAFGESPHAYLLTRRLERAASMLRTTDRPIAEIGLAVGPRSVGSSTSSFTRAFGTSPAPLPARVPPGGRPCDTDQAREGPMIRIAGARRWVHDQDEALAFSTQRVGTMVQADVTLPEPGGFRWLTASPPQQPDVAIVLMEIPGPPRMDEQAGAEVRGLMSRGLAGTIFLETDDCRASCEELRGRGVERMPAAVWPGRGRRAGGPPGRAQASSPRRRSGMCRTPPSG